MLDLSQYAGLLIFAAVGTAFVIGILALSALFRSRGGDPLRTTTYECGMEPIGSPYVSPNIRFYVFALMFVIFDIEAAFLFPWAVRFRELGLIGLVEVAIFVVILFVGFVYAWRKGALRWE